MEFVSPVYELLYLYQERKVDGLPPYWDLMLEADIIDVINKSNGVQRGRK